MDQTVPSPIGVDIRQVSARVTAPVRQRVLRPSQSVEDLARPEDDLPTTAHFAAFVGDAVVGTAAMLWASIVWPAGFTPGPDLAAIAGATKRRQWQLRGMATVAEVRGAGVGRLLLARCLNHVRDQAAGDAGPGDRLFWCHARTGAIGFYERFGLTAVGPEYAIPHAGPHRLMYRMIR